MKLLNQKSALMMVIVLFSLCFSISVFAQDSAALLKQVNQGLRQIERDMFSGKTDKSIANLGNIEKMISQIKADDPNNPKLKTAENKFNKLKKDLERRTGKSLGAGTLTAASASTATQMADKPVGKELSVGSAMATSKVTESGPNQTTEKLPYAARKPMANVNRTLSSLEGNLKNLADPGYGGNKDQLVGNIEKKIEQAKKELDEAKQQAAKNGVTSHPEFAAAETKIAEAEKSISAGTANYAEEKANAAASAKEVDADVAELKTIYDKAEPVFAKATGYAFHYNDLKTLEDVIVDIEDFENNDRAKAEAKMKKFAAKYGTTRDEIDEKADAIGFVNNYYRASYPYTEMAAGIENVSKTRDVMAEDIVRRTNQELDGISAGGADFHLLERYQKVKAWLKMAVRYQPDNPKVKELQSTIDQRIEAGMEGFHTRVYERSWQGHASNAPSNADELAEVSLKWFKNSPDWGKRSSKVRHPLAVVVTGPWSVQKRNLLSEPIMYGLPIKLAVKVDEDSELNVVRVYELTMRTGEMREVKMAPPFDHITVGNSYFIRPEKVK